MVGLADMAGKRPFQLSGGEQQRGAIAVALANSPALLLADEPTGELDSLTAQELISVLRQINTELGQTIILVTHDTTVAAQVDRTLAIRDGRTSTETIRRSPAQPVEPQSAPSTTAVLTPTAPESTQSAILERLQAVTQALAELGERDRLDVRIAGNHIEIWPMGARREESFKTLAGGTSSIIGLSLDSHRELVLVDRAGRLQLPKEALDLIPVNGRAEVQVSGDHVVLWPFVADKNSSAQTLMPVQENKSGKDGMQ
jgi:ABC-type glutathione transport system ATPase component